MVALLGACSDDYLDVNPITDITDSRLTDASTAETLINGVYEAMNKQYSGMTWNQNCGEAYVNELVGESCGMDHITTLFNNNVSGGVWANLSVTNSYFVIIPWMYYYNIANLSNYLIVSIPATAENHEGVENAVLGIKAQALTMRAHAYTRLLGIYGNRWEDTNEGTAYSIVLRTAPGSEPKGLSTMNEVLDQIYSDCDQAVKLFSISGTTRTASYRVDKSVALGIWARAAMMKHDWSTAAEKAAAAREGYTIMSESDLFAGFMTDNSETMWSMNPDFNTTYYWSWGSHYACNGTYTFSWGIGAGAINYDLVRACNPNDLRLKFFWTPDKLATLSRAQNPGSIKESDFWNEKMVDVSNDLNMTGTNIYDRTGKDTLGYGVLNALGWWSFNYLNNTFTGSREDIANSDNNFNSWTLMYQNKDPKKYVRLSKDAAGLDQYANFTKTVFGAQSKFWAHGDYGYGQLPWMRASEMYLTEAEALYMLGKEGEAKNALTAVNSKRIPNYTCTTSGDALLEEIKVSRRIELWGEGFAFYDLKRWNQPRILRKWVKNDPTSGNVPPTELLGYEGAQLERIQSVKYNNGWRFVIPYNEVNYNDSIHQELLPRFE